MTARIYLVTRHAGAREWAARRGLVATVVEHLDTKEIAPSDVVIGTLPAHLAARVCQRSGRYVHLAIDIPEAERGRSLSADEMQRFGARLVELKVKSIGPFRAVEAAGKSRTVDTSMFRRGRRLTASVRHWLARGPKRAGFALGTLVLLLLLMPTLLASQVSALWNCVRNSTCSQTDWWLTVGALAGTGFVYLLAFVGLAYFVRTVVWSRMHAVEARDSRCRALIMGLSNLSPAELEMLDTIAAAYHERAKDYCELKEDPKHRQLTNPWQQNVRAVFQHGEGLEAVLVLPSEESLKQWEAFQAFMGALFPPRLSIDYVRGEHEEAFKLSDLPGLPARSYEDYTYVWTGLSRAVDVMQEHFADNRRRPIADDEICIDVTAGQKTFSIAGANVTLNRELKLSYVSNEGVVTVYNAEIGTADAMMRVINSGGAGL